MVTPGRSRTIWGGSSAVTDIEYDDLGFRRKSEQGVKSANGGRTGSDDSNSQNIPFSLLPSCIRECYESGYSLAGAPCLRSTHNTQHAVIRPCNRPSQRSKTRNIGAYHRTSRTGIRSIMLL